MNVKTAQNRIFWRRKKIQQGHFSKSLKTISPASIEIYIRVSLFSKIRVFLLHLPLENLYYKWIWPLYRWKKICSDYRVHGIQIDRLRLTVSMQKSVLKNMHRVPRYHQKSVKNWPSKPNQQNLTHFGRFLWPRCIFFKIVFCVETVSPSRSIWIQWTL